MRQRRIIPELHKDGLKRDITLCVLVVFMLSMKSYGLSSIVSFAAEILRETHL